MIVNFYFSFRNDGQKLEEVTVEYADWAFFIISRASHSKDKK